MKIKVIAMFASMLLCPTAAMTQTYSSDKVKPQWTHRQPTPTNSTFRYEIVSAYGNTLDDARNNCLSQLIASSGMTSGMIVSSDYTSTEKLSQNWENGKLSETVTYNSNTNTSAKSEEVKLFVQNIDEYWTRDASGKYYLTKLYAKSELGTPPLFDNVELTTKYGMTGLWRSAIVPGWGQLYKGSSVKGGIIMGGTVALIGGIIYTDCMRSDYANKIAKTHIDGNKREYANRRDNFETGRNICIGALGALYVYNLIDAVVAPGARRVLVKERSDGGRFAIVPSITSDGYPAVACAITF